VMMDPMFSLPSKKLKKFVVTAEFVREQLDKSHLHQLEA